MLRRCLHVLGLMIAGVVRHVRDRLMPGTHVSGVHGEHWRLGHLGPCCDDEQHTVAIAFFGMLGQSGTKGTSVK